MRVLPLVLLLACASSPPEPSCAEGEPEETRPVECPEGLTPRCCWTEIYFDSDELACGEHSAIGGVPMAGAWCYVDGDVRFDPSLSGYGRVVCTDGALGDPCCGNDDGSDGPCD